MIESSTVTLVLDVVLLLLLLGCAIEGLRRGLVRTVGGIVGVTVGYHRLFTHKSFKAKPWLRVAMAITGSLASRARTATVKAATAKAAT